MAKLSKQSQNTLAFTNADALRQLFLRQNKSIAKAHSGLSVKVSQLESSISELQSENLKLRQDNATHRHHIIERDEEITSLQSDLQQSQLQVQHLQQLLTSQNQGDGNSQHHHCDVDVCGRSNVTGMQTEEISSRFQMLHFLLEQKVGEIGTLLSNSGVSLLSYPQQNSHHRFTIAGPTSYIHAGLRASFARSSINTNPSRPGSSQQNNTNNVATAADESTIQPTSSAGSLSNLSRSRKSSSSRRQSGLILSDDFKPLDQKQDERQKHLTNSVDISPVTKSVTFSSNPRSVCRSSEALVKSESDSSISEDSSEEESTAHMILSIKENGDETLNDNDISLTDSVSSIDSYDIEYSRDHIDHTEVEEEEEVGVETDVNSVLSEIVYEEDMAMVVSTEEETQETDEDNCIIEEDESPYKSEAFPKKRFDDFENCFTSSVKEATIEKLSDKSIENIINTEEATENGNDKHKHISTIFNIEAVKSNEQTTSIRNFYPLNEAQTAKSPVKRCVLQEKSVNILSNIKSPVKSHSRYVFSNPKTLKENVDGAPTPVHSKALGSTVTDGPNLLTKEISNKRNSIPSNVENSSSISSQVAQYNKPQIRRSIFHIPDDLDLSDESLDNIPTPKSSRKPRSRTSNRILINDNKQLGDDMESLESADLSQENIDQVITIINSDSDSDSEPEPEPIEEVDGELSALQEESFTTRWHTELASSKSKKGRRSVAGRKPNVKKAAPKEAEPMPTSSTDVPISTLTKDSAKPAESFAENESARSNSRPKRNCSKGVTYTLPSLRDKLRKQANMTFDAIIDENEIAAVADQPANKRKRKAGSNTENAKRRKASTTKSSTKLEKWTDYESRLEEAFPTSQFEAPLIQVEDV